MKAYDLDVLGISEMRWTEQGKIISDGTVVIYSGDSEHHVKGVGLLLNSTAQQSLIGWKPVNNRIVTARFQSNHAKVTIVQVYAPTEVSDITEKDEFYQQLQDTLDAIPKYDIKILMGDLNAQIDGNQRGLNNTIGTYGTGNTLNDNGERLVALCNANGLIVGNTFFKHKNIHKKTWRSPDGNTRNEIDFICISKRWRSSLQDVRVCRGADVSSDHYLLTSKIKLKLKRVKTIKTLRPMATEKLKDHDISKRYHLELSNRFAALQNDATIENSWENIKTVIRESAEVTVGRRRGSRKEQWISDSTWKLIDERRHLKATRDQASDVDQRREMEERYRQQDKIVKKSCRADKQRWIESQCEEAQNAATRNDTKTTYKIVRQLTGSSSSPTVPIKDKQGNLLLTEDDQNSRWVEHFSEILNQQTPDTLFDFTEERPPPQINISINEIRTDEVRKAIKTLKNNKSPGMDEITAEMLKHGKDSIVIELTKLFNKIWNTEEVPDDWRHGVIIKLPKKGNLSDFGNWRGITLLSIPGKVLNTVILNRLKVDVDKQLREEQGGFRNNRSCTEQILTLRNIMEQCAEHQKSLHINFIDFKKAFDSIHRPSMWHIIRQYCIPEKYINVFKNIYHNSNCRVKTNTGVTEPFNIITGVRQGCILSPFLFLMVVDFVMKKALSRPEYGVKWKEHGRLMDLDFADDIALLAEDRNTLQNMTNDLDSGSTKVGLRISCEKTKTMTISGDGFPLVIGQQQVEEVTRFTYLGSNMSADGDAEVDVNSRLGKAGAIFQKMSPIWSSKTISTKLKLQLYASIVMPTALYASETWKATEKIMKKLDVFHQRCLRRILCIKWSDYIRNEEVLRRANQRQMRDIIRERRLRFAGHVLRLEDERPAKVALTWVPADGRRKRGRPKKTWRATLKEDLSRLGVSWEEALELVKDRAEWRRLAAHCPTRDRRN